jgi:O-antigen ligase
MTFSSQSLGLAGLYLFALLGPISSAMMYLSWGMMFLALIPQTGLLFRNRSIPPLLAVCLLFIIYLVFQTLWVQQLIPEIAEQQWRASKHLFMLTGSISLIVGWWIAGNERRIKWILFLALTGLTIELIRVIDWSNLPLYLDGHDRFGVNLKHGPNGIAWLATVVLLGIEIFIAHSWKQTTRIQRFVIASLFLSYLLLLVLTQSRAAWGAYFITTLGLLSYYLLQSRLNVWHILARVIGIAIVFVLLCLSTLPIFEVRLAEINIEHESFLSRLQVWQLAWQKFIEHPLLGWGNGSSTHLISQIEGPYAVLPHFHNLYIQLVITNGLLGSFLLLLVYWQMYKKMISLWCENKVAMPIPIFILCSSVAFMLIGLLQIRADDHWGQYSIILMTAIAVSFYFKNNEVSNGS